MKKGIIALLSLVLLFSVTNLAQAGDRVYNLEGVIAQVTDFGIVLQTRRGDVQIYVKRDTRIMRNGELARLSDLRRGDHAHVEAKVVRRGDRRHLVALGIYARGDR